MKEQGQNIRELLKEKIKSLGGPFLPHQNYSLMGQLLGLLYNQEIPADLDERIQHRLEDDMMFQMERILYMTENQVQDFLYPTKDEQVY